MVLPVYAESSNILIFTQVILRDSEGILVTSFEPTKIGYLNELSLHNFLDLELSENDPIITRNNQQLQIIQRAGTLNYNSDNVISDTTLNSQSDNGDITTLVRLIHDGMPVTTGDELITIWTFIRPLN